MHAGAKGAPKTPAVRRKLLKERVIRRMRAARQLVVWRTEERGIGQWESKGGGRAAGNRQMTYKRCFKTWREKEGKPGERGQGKAAERSRERTYGNKGEQRTKMGRKGWRGCSFRKETEATSLKNHNECNPKK